MKTKTGKAYGFINCRQPKKHVAWIADDIRKLFAESVPLLDRLELSVNKGLSSLRKSRIEAKAELLNVVSKAGDDKKLSLRPGETEIRKGDAVLAHDFGNLYVIQASMPETSDKAVADELAAIVNQMYNSPLYDEGEPFRGIIAYWDNGKYVLRK